VGLFAVLIPLLVLTDCRLSQSNEASLPIRQFAKLKCNVENYIGHYLKQTIQLTKEVKKEVREEESPKVKIFSEWKVAGAGRCIRKDASASSHICGEDAWVVKLSPDNKKKSFLAVADGVGGWGVSGGDSSVVSNALVTQLANLALTLDLHVHDCAKFAFTNMIKEQIYKSGSTTLCGAVFNHETGMLDIVNLGDSSAFVIRDEKVFFKTEFGLQGFNAPNQIGFDEKGVPYGNLTTLASKHSIQLKSGDIVLLVTDGV